jgi:hypothetical protein
MLDLLRPLIDPFVRHFLRGVCYLVLVFYAVRAIRLITVGHGGHHATSQWREAMALVYTLVAAYFIFVSTRAIPTFSQNIVDGVGRVPNMPPGLIAFSYLAAGLVFAAFICNCSRSLWMLKSLDHGIFEPIPEWEELSEPWGKRIPEFVTRSIAAGLFILLEFELKKLSSWSYLKDLSVSQSGGIPGAGLSDIGKFALGLYFALLFWWLAASRIAGKRMPKLLLSFYAAGLVNALFIFFYGGPILSTSAAMWLVAGIVVVTIAAGWMLFFVLLDTFRECWKAANLVFALKSRKSHPWHLSGPPPTT